MITLVHVEESWKQDRKLRQANRPIIKAYQMENKARNKGMSTFQGFRYRNHGRHYLPLT